MDLFRLTLPLAAAAFFIWKARTSRIYLLGIPFLMFMGSSIFFEKARMFWAPGRLGPLLLTFLWLVVVWALSTDLLLRGGSRQSRRMPFGPRMLPEELLLVAIGGLVILSAIVTGLTHGDPWSPFSEALGMSYLLGGYVLLRGIVSQSPGEEVLRFLEALVVLNTVCAALFILHQGLGLPIYTGVEYYTESFQGVTITRTFTFLPQLLYLALAIAFAKTRWTAGTYVVAGVTLTCIWLSYTRTMLLMAVIVATTILAIRIVKRRQAGLAVRRLVSASIMIVVLGVATFIFLPAQTDYFLQRITRATSGVAVDPSVESRMSKLRQTYTSVAATSIAFGRGFVSEAQDPEVAPMKRYSSDGVWVIILFRLGLAGVFLFVALFAAFGMRSVGLALHGSGASETLGLVFTAYLAALFAAGFISWTFLEPSRYTLGLWPFAFVAAEAARRRLAGPEDTTLQEPV